MLTKKWYQSKTMWLNLLATILGILPLIDASLLNAIGITNTVAYLTVLGFVTTAGNMILRKNGQPTVISTKPTGSFAKSEKVLLLFVMLSLSAALFSSCKVTFVPAANTEMKTDVNNGAQKTDVLYLKMIGAPDKSFARYSSDYAEIEASINSIVLRDSLRVKGGNLFKSAQLLRDHFKTYSNDHQARRKLTTGELSAYMNYLRAFWRPLQIQENSLK